MPAKSRSRSRSVSRSRSRSRSVSAPTKTLLANLRKIFGIKRRSPKKRTH